HFRERCPQQCAAGWQVWFGEFADLDGHVGRRHDSGKNTAGHRDTVVQMSRTLASATVDLRASRTSSVALVEEALAAIDAHAAHTNAFVTVDREGALAAARTADRDRQQQVNLGPLHCLPISLKDLTDVAGVVTTAGSRVLAHRVAPADATVVTRLRDAGAIIIGRTNPHQSG